MLFKAIVSLSFSKHITQPTQRGNLSGRVEDFKEPTLGDADDRLRFPLQTRRAPIRVGLAAPLPI
jgi:hypothetical protein